MVVELHEPRLLDRLQRVAEERRQPLEQVLELAVQAYLDALEQEALHVETETFWALHDTLMMQYAGRHIALYRGKVVDTDEDVQRLEQRVRERFGAAPVLIAPVKPGPRRDVQWRGGRIERLEVIP